MVAAATALCLDSTNVHRQTKSTAFVSLAGAVVDHHHKKMALNFGISAAGKLLATPSPPADAATAVTAPQMDTLLVANAPLSAIAPISPSVAALRNEALAISSSSSPTPSPATPNGSQQQQATDENSPVANEALILLAEQLKERLLKASENKEFEEIARLVDQIQAANLSKSALEISRIGAVVNTLRRNVAPSHAELARKCRTLIKSWRTAVDALNGSSRPSSSCGSTATTPSLVSPAIKLKITPRGKTITPTSQLAFEGFSANASYAPSDKTSPQLALKRKISSVSPNAALNKPTATKRPKLSPAAIPTQPISVIEARRNVQSTESLVGALGLDKFFSTTIVEKRLVEEVVQLNGAPRSTPISIPSINSVSPPEKRGRKKREPKSDAQAPLVPRLKIRFGGKSAEEHDADESAKVSTLPDAIPSTSAPTDHRLQPVGKKSNNTKTKEPSKPEFSWYDKLPTIEELEMRGKEKSALNADKSTVSTDPSALKYRERTIIMMPYLEDDGPDMEIRERHLAQKPRRF